MRTIVSGAWLIVVLFLLAGCLDQKEATPTPTTSSTTTTPMHNGTTEKPLGVQAFDVPPTGQAPFRFNPATLSLKLNETANVTVTAPSTNQVSHNFVIDEFSVKLPANVAAGQSKSVSFTATKTGSFKFYCNVGNHRQIGMEGTLTVQ